MKTPSDKRAASKWIKANPLKHAAHVILATAVKRGKLAKLPCEVCGKIQTHGHHDDYTLPLSVRWLCAKHHKEAHGVIANPDRSYKPKGRPVPRKVSLLDQAQALRAQGLSYAAIGAQLGLSKSQTYKALNPREYD